MGEAAAEPLHRLAGTLGVGEGDLAERRLVPPVCRIGEQVIQPPAQQCERAQHRRVHRIHPLQPVGAQLQQP